MGEPVPRSEHLSVVLSEEHFTQQLLRQETALQQPSYKEHRMQLELALVRAEWQEKWCERIAMIAVPCALILTFVGGSKVVGAFDPFSRSANPLSITLGIIYCVCAVVAPLAIAAYFSRFRPRVRALKEEIRDTGMLVLQQDVQRLQQQVTALQAVIQQQQGSAS